MAEMTVRTNCPECGQVDIPANVVVLSVEPPGDSGRYTFSCPKCNQYVIKHADRKIIDLLIAVDEVRLEDAEGDWSNAFAKELSCSGGHRWDFPVNMGQACICGEKEWGGEG